MIRLIAIAATAAAAIALAGAPVAAGAKGNKHGGAHCPPGLAKKNPPCIPPGHAKIGDYYHDYDFEKVDRRDDRYDFYRIGDIVVSADRDTGRILQIFDELGNIIN